MTFISRPIESMYFLLHLPLTVSAEPESLFVTTPLDSRTQAVGDFTEETRRVTCDPSIGSPSVQLRGLVNLAIESVLAHLWEGGLLVPEVFTVRQSPSQAPEMRMFGDHRKIDTDLGASLRKSRQYVDTLMPEFCAQYVWAFDGFIGNQHSEAVVVEAAEAGELFGWRLAARYRFSKTGIALLDRDLIVIENVHTPFTAR
jgi:hypothetical protein